MPEAPAPPGAVTSDLENRLRERIERDGPIPFADFMEAALYDPRAGYYASGRHLGVADFRTSPQVHPAFAQLLAAQVAEMCRHLGSPRAFRCIELGPGDGTLAAGMALQLHELLVEEAPDWRLHLVEESPLLRDAQRRAVATLPAPVRQRVEWSTADELAVAPVDGVVVSNEFFDALPVHRVVSEDSHLKELRVAWDAERGFHEVTGPEAGSDLVEHLQRYGVPLQSGQQGEISLQAPLWIDRIAAMLSRGYVLAIDYGHPADRLYGPERPEGTLAAYHRHRVTDPFQDVGERDLTAHVNFTALEARAAEHGFQAAPLRSQTEFLLALGVLGRLQEIDEAGGAHVVRLKERYALKELFVPGGMGETFRVQVLVRGADLDLTGLQAPWRSSLDREPREP